MIAPIHLRKKIRGDYRLIVISDIHGHLDRLKALLHKVHYTSDDYLVILGDFVEKGDQVIDTIHFIQALDQNERTYVLTGNCEWALQALLTVPELANQIPGYLSRVSTNGCIREMYHKLHLDNGHETMLGVQKKIYEALKSEIDYVSHLPVTLMLNDFLFVHAGVERRKDYRQSALSSLLEMKYFYYQGHVLDQMVIVGHMPTSNYFENRIHNDILIDEEKKIICIDGGTGVKHISQLNALIIESNQNQISYRQETMQPLPCYVVIDDIEGKQGPVHKIGYPYFEVDILEEGKQFSLCYQEKTNQKLYIKNEFLYEKNNQTYCLDDYTDCMLSIKKGEEVKVIGIYDEYAYVISHQQVGWVKNKYLSMK